jgi:hypothetical protein
MKRHPIILILLSALVFTSCASHRYCASDFKADGPAAIPLVQPYVDIFTIAKGQETYSDTLSLVATNVLTGILEDNLTQFPISEFIQIDDADFDRLIGRSGAELADLGRSRGRNVSNLPLPDPIRQLMDENDLPYLMFLYESGFRRSVGDVVKQAVGEAAAAIGISIVTAILTGGAYIPTPILYGNAATEATSFTLLVADRQANAVAYYNFVEKETDPLDRSKVFTLLYNLFNKFPRR